MYDSVPPRLSAAGGVSADLVCQGRCRSESPGLATIRLRDPLTAQDGGDAPQVEVQPLRIDKPIARFHVDAHSYPFAPDLDPGSRYEGESPSPSPISTPAQAGAEVLFSKVYTLRDLDLSGQIFGSTCTQQVAAAIDEGKTEDRIVRASATHTSRGRASRPTRDRRSRWLCSLYLDNPPAHDGPAHDGTTPQWFDICVACGGRVVLRVDWRTTKVGGPAKYLAATGGVGQSWGLKPRRAPQRPSSRLQQKVSSRHIYDDRLCAYLGKS